MASQVNAKEFTGKKTEKRNNDVSRFLKDHFGKSFRNEILFLLMSENA